MKRVAMKVFSFILKLPFIGSRIHVNEVFFIFFYVLASLIIILLDTMNIIGADEMAAAALRELELLDNFEVVENLEKFDYSRPKKIQADSFWITHPKTAIFGCVVGYIAYKAVLFFFWPPPPPF
jgi:hypothetical protein